MKHIDKYIDAYFEGTLSEKHEKLLKSFLSSTAGQAAEYDEIRAVMGYFAMGAPKTPANRVWLKYTAIAAGLLLFACIGMSFFDADNECVAYVNGQKISDRELVMNDVESTLASLVCDGPDVEQQLSEFFGK